MLKEKKLKKQLGFFCHIFVISDISIGRAQAPGYAYVMEDGLLKSSCDSETHLQHNNAYVKLITELGLYWHW